MVSDKSHVPRQVGVPESRGLCLKLGVIDERDGAAIDSDGAAFLETTKSSSHNLASATNDLCDLALGEPALHIDTRAKPGCGITDCSSYPRDSFGNMPKREILDQLHEVSIEAR